MSSKVEIKPTAPCLTTCQFFRLPAELRNQVYEYALTHSDNLIHVVDENGLSHFSQTQNETGHFPNYPGEPSDFNALQYVSRQMRHETKCLELRYNNLTFSARRDEGNKPIQDFINFLNHCSPEKLEWIRGVSILLASHPYFSGYRTPARDCIPQALDFCFAHPNTRVVIQLAEFTQPGGSFISLLNMLAVHEAFRGPIFHCLRWREWGQEIEKDIKAWRYGRSLDQLNASNCRFSSHTSLDKAKTMRCISEYVTDVDVMREKVKVWFAEGI